MKQITSNTLRGSVALCLCLIVTVFHLDPARAASATNEDWNVVVLDQLLASVPSDQQFVQISDMEIPVTYLQQWRNKLAGGPQPKIAFSGTFTKWTGGNVYYQFDTSVTASDQRAFLDAAKEWAAFANLHFIARTAEANYILVTNNPSLGGGQSFVGMVGGPQLLQIGPSSWNRGTLVHELGHALGLVHEHQRSDRDSFVTIVTNNILSGHLSDFVLLTDSQNKSSYDFLSVMHYSRNAFSVDPASNTIVPLPAYSQYLNLIGHSDPVLSAADRAGMALVYGAGPGVTNIVSNTQDGGPGSLRAAMYYAFDYPGTTISFNIPTSDAGFSNGVFNILPTDGLPGIFNDTIIDGSSEPTNSNPNGPEILLNGALCQTPSTYTSGLQFMGANSVVHSLVINNFPECSILMEGSGVVANTVSGCYLGIDASGTVAVTNGFCPVLIDGGAISNLVGGTASSARNVISGSGTVGLIIRDAGTRFNQVAGNYIGLNTTGTAALPNFYAGVEIYNGAQSNLIGSGLALSRNVISGNTLQGVLLSDPATTGNIVAGNLIGLNANGSVAIANGWAGVEISGGSSLNVVGGFNLISGNGNDGVLIYDTSNNIVRGNWIGLDASGSAAVPNAWRGVDLYGGAAGNFIGGPGDARNFISGNSEDGIIAAFGSSGNTIQGNSIGLDVQNQTAVPNGGTGVLLYSDANANIVGGLALGAPNLIAGNSSVGVWAGYSATNNTIRGNSIFNNGGGSAIYLYSGGNNGIVAPTLTSATVTTNTTVAGSYTGTLGKVYQLDFYADASPDYSAQAMTYLGATNITGTGGSSAFTAKLGARLPAGRSVTATVTDPSGNTSQLSTGVSAAMTSTPNDGIPDAWRALYFGGSGTTTNNQSASFADPDSDGMNNFGEFLAGTNPTNAASVLKLAASNPNISTNVVRLNSVNGIVYRVLYRNDLSAGYWSILADQLVGTGTNIDLPDAGATTSTRRFYRAQVLW